jgi:hypothetical protein
LVRWEGHRHRLLKKSEETSVDGPEGFATPSIPLLDRLDQIDGAWLEAVLGAGGFVMRVRSFAAEPIGAGNVSDTARIVLEAEGEGPRSVIAKFRPMSDAVHGHGVGSGAYRCEAGAYRLFASRPDGCRTPGIVWLQGQDDNINIVMEDLSRHTRAGDQIAGCGIADAHAVVAQLARLHRGFWPLADAEAPDWLLRMPACGDYWAPVTEAGAAVILDRYRDRLPTAFLATVERAGPLSRAWHDLTHRTMTVTHGDPRVDNILFEDLSAGPDAILIDWQVTGLRNAMHDVGYFLSTSVAPEDRRTHERTLIECYADEFGKSRGYGDGAMIDDYRVQLASGLMTVIAAAALLPDDERANRLLSTLLDRTCSAVVDWDSLDALSCSA